MAERQRVLHVGPDVPGGMRTSLRALFGSRLAEEFELDFVATHTGTGAAERVSVFLAALAKIAWWGLRRRGRVVHVHATVRGSMYRKAICVLLAKALGRHVVLHVHSGPGDVETFRTGLGRPSLALFRLAFGRADAVLAVSAASSIGLERAFGASGIVVVPNAVPVVAGLEARGGRKERPLAVYLGGFANPVKGGDVLVDALRRPEAGNLAYVLAGPGEPPPGSLEDTVAPVDWRGWIEDDGKDALLREADVFVLASTSEGLPMALLEAMSYGLAIVATAVGGVPDVVADGEQALVVAPGEASAMAVALGRLGSDPGLRERLGTAARARSADFSPDAVAAEIGDVYRRLLGGAPVPQP
jgi:glycosyltransferase involved in cell wall biosynthesis